MILVIGGIKGGSGKTTIATNLTVLRSSIGKKVLLVDADEQKSAYDWASQRDGLNIPTDWTTVTLSGSSIYAQIERMAPDYDDVIVDVGGRDTTSQRSALTIADAFLIPFKPRSLDIWTLGGVKKMISEISSVNRQLISMALINQADNRGSDNEDSLEILKECESIRCLSSFIQNRKAFCHAASEGLGVTELKPTDKKAIQEIRKVHDEIYQNDI